MQTLTFDPVISSEKEAALRLKVRRFLQQYGDFPTADLIDSWTICDADFSKALAEQGWIGMTWPEQYGGGGCSYLERYVVIEELLAAGAPVGAHWVADRQSGPLLLRFGTQSQREFFLPQIIKGECFFAIGMSEPNSGSDLASIKTSAKRVDGGWLVNGAKTWTSWAHACHYMITLCRTAPVSDNRHAGLSQLIIDLSADGVTIRPIKNLAGDEHFNEIFFDNVFVPDEQVAGTVNDGWNQVMAELAFERSGPERFLSSYQLLEASIGELRQTKPDARAMSVIGQFVAKLMVLRQMSLSVASQLQDGKLPVNEASVVKDLGTSFEQDLPEAMRLILSVEPRSTTNNGVARLLSDAILKAPSFSLRGGTREILRGILARGLGLR
ncbi:MAG TPA: acyl-CoA dehydrogenase [Cycloclasticus sp.]|jgi:alkylation response protein AidB-like acyl-CoA dehydrogenase|nr:acyl-CoA dehydrogenase [Cycloclasticus sp.]HIL92296.1 acyl-CoA dehydrogenase [Cycloclasticus sp.]